MFKAHCRVPTRSSRVPCFRSRKHVLDRSHGGPATGRSNREPGAMLSLAKACSRQFARPAGCRPVRAGSGNSRSPSPPWPVNTHVRRRVPRPPCCHPERSRGVSPLCSPKPLPGAMLSLAKACSRQFARRAPASLLSPRAQPRGLAVVFAEAFAECHAFARESMFSTVRAAGRVPTRSSRVPKPPVTFPTAARQHPRRPPWPSNTPQAAARPGSRARVAPFRRLQPPSPAAGG